MKLPKNWKQQFEDLPEFTRLIVYKRASELAELDEKQETEGLMWGYYIPKVLLENKLLKK